MEDENSPLGSNRGVLDTMMGFMEQKHGIVKHNTTLLLRKTQYVLPTLHLLESIWLWLVLFVVFETTAIQVDVARVSISFVQFTSYW
jgi:hypothetical protein